MEKNEMDNKLYALHAEMCKTLSHPIRLKIINLLRNGEKPVSELLSKIGGGKANLSQHLTVLRRANIVSTRKVGLNIYYRITKPKMIKACDIVREVIFEQFEESKSIFSKLKRKL